MSHDWIIKFLEHDIADKRFISLIKRFLEAGYMEQGIRIDTEEGSRQGNIFSPVIANVYLHYVLDTWFEIYVKRCCKGEAFLVRYADDFACCFQYQDDAHRFYVELKRRFEKFNLELSEEKTRILEFGRFAECNRKRKGLGKPETFDFLGFTFYCGKSRSGRYAPKVKTRGKKYAGKLKDMNIWLKNNREQPVESIVKHVNQVLQGHYNYYGVTCNARSLYNFRREILKLLYKWLNRRSQRRSYTWTNFTYGLLKTLQVINPRIKVNIYNVYSNLSTVNG